MGKSRISPDAGSDPTATTQQPAPNTRQRSLRSDLQHMLKTGGDRSGITRVGSISFPQSNRPPAKWARVAMEPDANDKEHKVEVKAILELMSSTAWNLHKPCALISVTGAAKALDISEQLKQEFQRGLLEAVSSSDAWVTTGGTSSGVMELVGRTLRSLDNAVCIGVVPWRAVQGHDRLQADEDGIIANYLSLVDGAPKPPDWQPDWGEPARLDANHTHFLLADDPSGDRPWGGEIELRSALEESICPDHADNVDMVYVPLVMLVLGGGKGTLDTVLAALQNDRPVVVLPESGGAARAIYEVCIRKSTLQRAAESVQAPGEVEQEQFFKQVVESLASIKDYSARYKGARDEVVPLVSRSWS
jgi:hypothetical protein